MGYDNNKEPKFYGKRKKPYLLFFTNKSKLTTYIDSKLTFRYLNDRILSIKKGEK